MGLFDSPSAKDILAAVREFLLQEVRPLVENQPIAKLHFGIALSLLGVIERELTLGPKQEAEVAQALAALGVSSEAELAQAIRTGQLDSRRQDLMKVLQAITTARLQVNSPRYLEQLLQERQLAAQRAQAQKQQKAAR
jgi:hypothetical protein